MVPKHVYNLVRQFGQTIFFNSPRTTAEYFDIVLAGFHGNRLRKKTNNIRRNVQFVVDTNIYGETFTCRYGDLAIMFKSNYIIYSTIILTKIIHTGECFSSFTNTYPHFLLCLPCFVPPPLSIYLAVRLLRHTYKYSVVLSVCLSLGRRYLSMVGQGLVSLLFRLSKRTQMKISTRKISK